MVKLTAAIEEKAKALLTGKEPHENKWTAFIFFPEDPKGETMYTFLEANYPKNYKRTTVGLPDAEPQYAILVDPKLIELLKGQGRGEKKPE